jgi:hypothetical protein
MTEEEKSLEDIKKRKRMSPTPCGCDVEGVDVECQD